MVPVINNNFTNIKGKNYDKVREIAYKKGELFGNLGTLVNETNYESTTFFGSEFNMENGVYIYQSHTNPLIAYRIYKEFADYKFNGYSDDILIQQLMKKQENIKLSKFPTGVVTLDGYIIGQEIPYFPECIDLKKYFLKYKDIEPFKIYRAVLEIIKEMYENNIYYLDIHGGNFMINPNNQKINIIDFEYGKVKFDCEFEFHYKEQVFKNLKIMIDNLNKIYKINLEVGEFLTTNNFDDTFAQIEQMEKKLIKM